MKNKIFWLFIQKLSICVHIYDGRCIIQNSHFGFQKGRSTIPAVPRIVNDMVKTLERGKLVSLNMCELNKAIDCVCHHRLLLIKVNCTAKEPGDSLKITKLLFNIQKAEREIKWWNIWSYGGGQWLTTGLCFWANTIYNLH